MDSDNKHGGGAMQNTENGVIADAADLFAPVFIEKSIIDGSETMYRPLNRSNEGPIEFNIKPMGMKYFLPKNTYLHAQLKITLANGDDMPADSTAAFVNMALNSLFKSIDIEIGGVPCPDLGNSFANYKAYFETVLTYSENAENGHLRASHFRMDTANAFQDYNIADANVPHNQGYRKRRHECRESRSIQADVPIHCDFFQLNKYIPPGVEITVRFHRASDAFCIVAAVNNIQYKVEIEDIKLYVRHVTLSEDVMQLHMKLLEKGPAVFPYNRTLMKTVAYPGGLTHITASNLFGGILPKSILIALVNATNFNGTYTTNPYFLQHFHCNYAVLNVNGENVPSDPYRPNFALGLFSREYRSFFNNVGIGIDNVSNMMTPDLYAGGMFMIPFDLSPDLCNGYHAHLKKSGVINLELNFTEAIANPFYVIAFATYDNVMLLDRDNNVKTDMMYSN